MLILTLGRRTDIMDEREQGELNGFTYDVKKKKHDKLLSFKNKWCS